MGRSAGTVTLRFEAGTAGFVADLEKAKAKVREFGGEAKSTFSARYAIFGIKDIAEGRGKFALAEMVNEVTRLRGALLGLGVGTLALAGIGVAAYEITKHLREAAEMPLKIRQAFAAINEPLQITNDSLAVTNAKLENEIAKLEGKPQNGLKVALLEAQEAADKLAESLGKDLGALDKLLKTQGVSRWGEVMGKAGSGFLSEEIGGATSSGGFIGRVNAIGQMQGPRINRQGAYLKLYDEELAKFQQWLNDANRLQQKREQELAARKREVANPYGGAATIPTPDQSQNIELLKEGLRNLQLERIRIVLEGDAAALAKHKDVLAADAEEAKKHREELARQRTFERSLDRYDREHGLAGYVSPEEFKQKLEKLDQAGENYGKGIEKSLREQFKPEKFDIRELTPKLVAPRPAGYETSAMEKARLEFQAQMAGENTLFERPEVAAARELAARLNIIETLHKREMTLAFDEQSRQEANDKAALESAQARYQYEERIAQIRKQRFESATEPLVNGLSNEIAKAATGQKTSFGKMFQGIGQDAVRNTAKTALQYGIGAIGKHFGFGVKPDGSTADRALWVRQVGAGGKIANVPIFGGGSLPLPIPGGKSAGGGGFFASLLQAVIPHEEGGPMSPSEAYLVGEKGPELLTRTSGYITSNAELQRTFGGGGHTFGPTYVDARGSELGTEQRVARAVQMGHDAAVANSLRAQKEHSMRTPQRR